VARAWRGGNRWLASGNAARGRSPAGGAADRVDCPGSRGCRARAAGRARWSRAARPDTDAPAPAKTRRARPLSRHSRGSGDFSRLPLGPALRGLRIRLPAEREKRRRDISAVFLAISGNCFASVCNIGRFGKGSRCCLRRKTRFSPVCRGIRPCDEGAPTGAPFRDPWVAAQVSRLEKRTVVARAR